MLKKRNLLCILFIILSLIFCGCNKKEADDNTEVFDDSSVNIYYLNSEGDSLCTYPTNLVKETDVNSVPNSVTELLNFLETPLNDDYQAPITEEMKVEYVGFEDEDNDGIGVVTVDLGSVFPSLDYVDQVLCKAAIVRTLCQLDRVEGVAFLTDGSPYTDSKDPTVQYLTEEDIITNMDSLYDNVVSVTLYLSNTKGDKLVPYETEVEVEGNESLEYVIVRSLRDVEPTDTMKSPLPENLTINSVNVYDGTCYVDLGEEILEPLPDVERQITVYSMVNSLLDQERVSSVQFLINGELVQDITDFGQFNKLFVDALKLFE